MNKMLITDLEVGKKRFFQEPNEFDFFIYCCFFCFFLF